MTMTTQENAPNRGAREIQQWVIAQLTEAYAPGEPPPGESLALDWSESDEAWTAAEIREAWAYTAMLFLWLAWEVDAAHARGDVPDVAGFLRNQALQTAASASDGPVPDHPDAT